MKKNDYSFVLVGAKGEVIRSFENPPKGTLFMPFVFGGEHKPEILREFLGNVGMELKEKLDEEI